MSQENPFANKNMAPLSDNGGASSENQNEEKPERFIAGKQSQQYEEGRKEARYLALENRLAADDSYENWLDLGRTIRVELYAQEDPEFKKRLEALIKKSQWQKKADEWNEREDRKVEARLKIRQITGIQDMRQIDGLLDLYAVDPERFALVYPTLINKN